MVRRHVIMCSVFFPSLFSRSCCLAIVKVFSIGILTYRSFMSYVIVLCCSFILSAEMSRAKFSEFGVLY
jgi:hypothetical protein